MESSPLQNLPTEHVSVLIVGGSMVGMTLSALLADAGIHDVVAVEKHASTAIHPRAALFHPRSMSVYRSMGLYEAMHAESLKYYDDKSGVHEARRLNQPETQISSMKDVNEGVERLSPVRRLFLTQQMFELMLRERAESGGTQLCFNTILEGFKQDQDGLGVTAVVRAQDSGSRRIIKAMYMIGCDGNRSGVRDKLGIGVTGHGLLSRAVTIYFKADLQRFVEGKMSGVVYTNNEDIRAFFRITKDGQEGFLCVLDEGKDGHRHPADGMTNERAKSMLRAAIGEDIPSLEITMISRWNAVCDVAEKFVNGRVILAGDAAHTVTPHGGYGGNTGIQDAQNLAWKLAAVLNGHAGPSLIQTYQDERWPISKLTTDAVFSHFVDRSAPDMRDNSELKLVHVPDPHLELGYRYYSHAIVADEPGSLTEDPETAIARAGSIAHHAMVTTAKSGKEPIPLEDLVSPNRLTLLTGCHGEGWLNAAAELNGNNESFSLVSHRVTGPSEGRQFLSKYAIGSEGATIVRPDRTVAWSATNAAPDSKKALEVLRAALQHILCLD